MNNSITFSKQGKVVAAFLIAILTVCLSAGPARADNLTWNVAGSGTWDTSTANWTGDDTVYADGGVDTVTFNNSAGGVITLNANHFPSAVTVSAAAGTYQFTGASITGSVAITKSGAGTLELRSDVLSTGGLFINGGIVDASQLKQTGGSVYGGTVNPIHFTGNGTLRISGTGGNYTYSPMIIDAGVTATLDQTAGAGSQFAGLISGDGGIIVTGAGTPIRFQAGSTFKGNVTVSATGALATGDDSSLGDPNKTIIMNGGSLQLSLGVLTTYNAARTLLFNNSSSQIAPFSGGATWNGLVTGTGFTLTGIQGYGQASFNLANANNTFVGDVYVLTGTLEVNTQGSLNGNNVRIGNGGGNGLRVSGTPTGNFTGNLRFENGGGAYHFIDVVNAGATMNLTGALNTDTTANQTLRKYGLGTLNLNNEAGTFGANGGKFDVMAGRLNINYTTPSMGGVTVQSGGTLGGSGTINGTVTLNSGGKLAPGNSPGTLTTGAETWNGGAGYVFEMNNATGTAGSDPGWDLANINGALTLNATSGNPFTVFLTSLTLANTAGNAVNFDNGAGKAWLFVDSTSTISTYTGSSQFAVNTSAFSNLFQGGWRVVRGDFLTYGTGDNSQLYLEYTGVPEPTVLMLVVGGALIVVARRRKA